MRYAWTIRLFAVGIGYVEFGEHLFSTTRIIQYHAAQRYLLYISNSPDILMSKSVVVVSGADGALGTCVCSAFADAGWHVHASVRSLRNEQSLRHIGVDTIGVADLLDLSSLRQSLSDLPSVHAVVHCAGGISAGKSLEETDPGDFDAMMKLNAQSTFNILHCTMPRLKQNGGTVVTIGAQSVLYPAANRAAYTAVKAAVVALTQAAAEEGRSYGVRAHVIVPGILKTAANMEWATNGEEYSWIEPRDVASTILSLCSAHSSHISGLIIPMIHKVGS
jgi:NAD(P)-dependent dehydrogenase (short-subunit alcohol dehydrogenase family)